MVICCCERAPQHATATLKKFYLLISHFDFFFLPAFLTSGVFHFRISADFPALYRNGLHIQAQYKGARAIREGRSFWRQRLYVVRDERSGKKKEWKRRVRKVLPPASASQRPERGLSRR